MSNKYNQQSTIEEPDFKTWHQKLVDASRSAIGILEFDRRRADSQIKPKTSWSEG
jgi:hypothetical protein